MNSQIEKVTMYSRNGKKPMIILEDERLLPETKLSSNDDNHWPEVSPSKKALRRLIVRSEVRHKQRPEPLHRHHKRPKTVRETKTMELKITCLLLTELQMRGTSTP